ncbi:lysophospholipid acyltransferase 1-like isoform X2 [Symsagittifera roscoffensis]|uniref:lysophospholipid acyltransferase 1-like isoform X2 n=1 Tax=Symsagittifera roscoffensis TaxID=84072 RepID=UPI00307B735C
MANFHFFNSIFKSIDLYVVKIIPLTLESALFMLVNIAAIPLGFVLQWLLTAPRVGENVRHLYSTFIGLFYCVLCFRWNTVVCLVPIIAFYPLLNCFLTNRHLGKITLFLSLFYLLSLHVYRHTLHYGQDKVDHTVFLMFWFQKITYMAYNLQDGQMPESELVDDFHKKKRITQLPSFLTYCSYFLTFLGFQMLPAFCFSDYADFIRGTNLTTFEKQDKASNTVKEKHPSPNWMALTTIPLSIIYFCTVLMLSRHFPIQRMIGEQTVSLFHLKDESYITSTSFLYKVGYCWIAMFLFRLRYYFTWKLAESSCYASGLGFSGWTEEGKEKWELVRNGDITRVEFCTSWKEFWDSWNNMTGSWLRFICYSRIEDKTQATALTFLLSSVWHGFHPGYFVLFAHSYILVLLGRKFRHSVRPFFQGTLAKKRLYNILGCIAFQLTISYTFIGLETLEFAKTFTIYRSMNFYVTTIIIVLFGALPEDELDSSRSHSKPEEEKGTVARDQKTKTMSYEKTK